VGRSTFIDSAYTRVGLKSLQGNGSFEFPNLLPGNYRLQAYSYFSGSRLYFYENAIPAEAGVITQADIVYELGMAQVDLNPTGFLSRSDINSGYAYANWTAPNPNPGQKARTVYVQYDSTSGQLTGAVTSGE